MWRDREHLRFLGRTACFLALPVLSLAIVEAAYWRVGESRPATMVVDAQREAPETLYLRARFPQQFACYKLAAVRERSPSIVVFGSSRVMKFRSELFGAEAAAAYNFGGLGSLRDLTMVVDRWESPPPGRVLLGIDPWWLNREYAAAQLSRPDDLHDAAWSWQAHLAAIRKTVRSDRSRLWQWLSNPAPLRLGIAAQQGDSGFRADGSMRGDLPVPQTDAEWVFVDRESPSIAERVRTGANQFVETRGVDDDLTASLREELRRFHDRGTKVIGFFPPVAAEVESEIARHSAQAKFWHDAHEVVPRLFAEFEMPFFDFSTTRTIGVDDSYLIDGFHCEEACAARMLAAMLNDTRVSQLFPAARPAVERALANPKSNRWYLNFATGPER